jgi:hypothetical protein
MVACSWLAGRCKSRPNVDALLTTSSVAPTNVRGMTFRQHNREHPLGDAPGRYVLEK